jgi:hypothetical protein
MCRSSVLLFRRLLKAGRHKGAHGGSDFVSEPDQEDENAPPGGPSNSNVERSEV